MIHQLINLIQQIQPPARVLCFGDPGVDAAGDLIDVISNMMDLRPQGFDLLGGPGFNRLSLNESDKKGPFREAALFRLVR